VGLAVGRAATGRARRRGKGHAAPLRTYFAALLIVYVAVAAAAAVFVDRAAVSESRSEAHGDMTFAASAAARDLASGFQLIHDTVHALAANPGVELVLTEPKACSLSFSLTGGTGYVAVLDRDGRVACSSTRSDIGRTVSPQWLAGVLRKDTVRAPLRDPLSGAHVAVAAAAAPKGAVALVALNLDTVGPSLARAHSGGHETEIVVLGPGGRIVTRSIAPRRTIGEQLSMPSTSSASRDASGVSRIYGGSAVKGFPYTVFAGEPQATVDAARNRLERRGFAIIVGGLLVALLTAIVVYRRVVGPIRELSRRVRTARTVGAPSGAVTRGPAEVRWLAEDVDLLVDSVARELTERQEAEDQVLRTAASYRLLFDRHPAPMWVYDSGTLDFLDVNEAAVHSYGFTRDEFLSMTIDDIRPDEDRTVLRDVIADVDRRDVGGHLTWKHVKKDGSAIEATIRSTDLEFDGRAARLVLAQDVTEQRRLEAQLLQAQKMEAVGSLAGGIAHDFNNLLTVVRASAGLVLPKVDDPAVRADIELMDQAAERGAALTHQLLAFSRQQVLRPELADLNAMVKESLALLERVLGEDVEVQAKLADGLPPILIDTGQLSQSIVNLAVNAREAMPDGGRLLISTFGADLDAGYTADHPEARPGRHVVLQIADTGVGMTREQQQRVFEPFYTTKARGTGLGLATVFGIVRQSGGHIGLYSEPGIGTTFKLYFPIAEAAEAARAAGPEHATAYAGGGETVLLVEDDPTVRGVVERMLSSSGYLVLEADSPERAVELVAAGAAVDLVITDVVMPGMNGGELAAELERRRPGLRFLFTSGYPAEAAVRAGYADASAAYIEKPFTAAALAAAVGQALAA